MDIKGGKGVFQNVVVLKGLLLDATGKGGEKGVDLRVLYPGVETGDGPGQARRVSGAAHFQLPGGAVGDIAGAADDLPDTVLNFLAGGRLTAFVDDPGNGGNGNAGLGGNLF